MDLILWRHAEARDAAADEPGRPADAADGHRDSHPPGTPDDGLSAAADLARPLTPRGEKQAARMAEWLNRFLPDRTRILVSPALRCQQTARALDRRSRSCDALLPGAGVSQLLDAARWPDAREPVLMVGHQPTLGLAAAYLMGAMAAGPGEPPAGPVWSVRKGAVWWLRRRLREGRAEVVLVAVRTPDLL